MGIYPKKNGELTESQKYQADQLGITHEEYKKFMIERIVELRGGNPVFHDEGNKKDDIVAKKPVLIIGHGPSFYKNLENIKSFKGIKVCVDHSLEDCLEHEIYPDYVTTSESSKQTCKLYYFNAERIVDKGITVIHSSITRDEVVKRFNDAGVPIRQFIFPEEPRCSNVGLFSVNFAKDDLKADKIILVGFEHMGNEYNDHVYRTWQTDFFYFMKKWPKETIVNCTDGGALYNKEYIIQTTLDKLKINEKPKRSLQRENKYNESSSKRNEDQS